MSARDSKASHPPFSLTTLLVAPLGIAVAAYLIAMAVIVLVPIGIMALLLYVAAPVYQEFLPTLSPFRRKLAYAAMLLAVLGPLAGAYLTYNLGGILDPAKASWIAVAAGIAGLILGATGLLAGAFWRLKQYRLIVALPTSKIASAALGLVELKGTVRSARPGTPVIDTHHQVMPPIIMPGFWLEDESGKVWVEPGDIPVRARMPRAFGFKINDIILTRNSMPKKYVGATRLALFEGDRVYVVGQLRQGEKPHWGTGNWVGPAPQQGSTRDYRHVFMLSDSSEEAALRHVSRGIRQSWMLAWIWVAMSLAVALHAMPRAMRIYDSWTLREIGWHVPVEQRSDVLVARWVTKQEERRDIALALAEHLRPPGTRGAFEILAAAMTLFPDIDRNTLYAGMGKLEAFPYRVVPYLVDGVQNPQTRTAAGTALYAVSRSKGFNSPQKDVIRAFDEFPGDACAALTAFRKQWWVWNIGGPVGLEMMRRCTGEARQLGAELVAERVYDLTAADAGVTLADLDAEGRAVVLRTLLYRTTVKQETAVALAKSVHDANPEVAAYAGAIAAKAGVALPATAETGLAIALYKEETEVRRAALQALRAVPQLSRDARAHLLELGVKDESPDGREALQTLAQHEPEPDRKKLLELLRIGHVHSVRAMYRASSLASVAPGSLPYGFSITATIRTAQQFRQLNHLAHKPEARAYVQQQVITALRSTNQELRKAAAIFISQRRQFTHENVLLLGQMLEDSDAGVRRWASDALLKLATPPESIRTYLEQAAARRDYENGESVRSILKRYDEPITGGAKILK